jgi:voltage-gated potassium channel
MTLVALVSGAVAGAPDSLFFTIIAAAVVAAVAAQYLFPPTRLFPITFAHLTAVYAAIFGLFVEGIFTGVDRLALALGFSLPMICFLIGCWMRREEVRAAVRRTGVRTPRLFVHSLFWLAPVSLVGVGVYLLSGFAESAINSNVALLAAMALIGAIVFAVSRDVAIFLAETGLLLDDFAARIARLAIPAFAFLTYYALLVIVFGAIYTLMSQSAAEHFRVFGAVRPLSFAEAMYFSVVTVSTVGFGDIVPSSNAVRLLASLQVLASLLLLLFGVSELLDFMREQRRRHARAQSGERAE